MMAQSLVRSLPAAICGIVMLTACASPDKNVRPPLGGRGDAGSPQAELDFRRDQGSVENQSVALRQQLAAESQGSAQQQNSAGGQQPPTSGRALPGRGATTDSAGRGGKVAELAERVWLNTASGVYHCAGTASYGPTKDGRYLPESTAISQGHRPARNTVCGPIRVWLNTNSGIYHCPGSANYGSTAAGKYMTEPEARKANMRPAGGRAC
jgi:hypothetical protein